MKPYESGAIVGKFLPPTIGHAAMIDFASRLCRRVRVVVDCVPYEDRSATERARWLSRHFAGRRNVQFVPLREPTPQEPHEHPDFWEVWRDIMVGAGDNAQVLIASETYGEKLADVMGATFIPFDVGREGIDVSATRVRADAWGMWDKIIPEARVSYLHRIALEGPESTGKTTLARKMASAFGLTVSPEWAAGFIRHTIEGRRAFARGDLTTIAYGQEASEAAIEPHARRAVVYDSTLLTTMAWSQFLYGGIDADLEERFAISEAARPKARFFLTPDTEFVPDAHRNVAERGAQTSERLRFLEILEDLARQHGLPYQLVPGGHAEKEAAMMGVAASLTPPVLPAKP